MDNLGDIPQNDLSDMLEHSFAFRLISELVSAVKNRDISPVELVDLLLLRIRRLDPLVNSYLCVNPEARKEAEEIEKLVSRGRVLGPLCGVPISIKDIIVTGSLPTTAGSKVFGAGLKSEREAEVVKKLRRAGAIILGKTNLHEFAFGITSENEHYGPVKNPWNLNHIAGGSSGGSAAAVVSGLSIGSIGTDTRGSIRIPSACCGATGLKPTFEAVSTDGVLPLSWTLDHVGPIAASVADAAILLAVISRQSNLLRGYQEALNSQIGSLRIGLCPYYFRRLDSAVKSAVDSALQVFEDAGVTIISTEIDTLDEALEASDIITRAEAVTIHDSNLTHQPESYGNKVRERLSTGYRVSGMDFVKATRVRLRTLEAFRQAFSEVDCLLAPTLPVAPPKLGTETVRHGEKEDSIVNEFVRFNAPQNVAGLPALAIPCGFTTDSLPIGMQLIAWRKQEAVLFSLGSYFQQVTDWHLRRPPLSA